METAKLAEKILSKGYVCDHCLGRQLAQLLSGYEAEERGKTIRIALALEVDVGGKVKIDPVNFAGIKFRNVKPKDVPEEAPECKVCKDIFKKVPDIAKRVAKELSDYEYKTFLVGTRPSKELVENEEELWENAGANFSEPLKAEMNRLVGKAVSKLAKKDVDFKKPDVHAIFDVERNDVELQVSSVFVFGEYKKLVRGIPQTRWPCRACRGLGCEKCDWTGKQYKESVEELVGEVPMEVFEGTDTKFHGAGREDIDALNLGGREFVIEIREPKKRKTDLKKLEKEINKRVGKKVTVSKLKMSAKDEIVNLKEKKADKTYRALCSVDSPVKASAIKKLKELEGTTIKQRTPKRVVHRRADKVRDRKVLKISGKVLNDKEIELHIKGEAGLYIKELVSGDDGRTKPNVSELLGVKAVVKDLDVELIE